MPNIHAVIAGPWRAVLVLGVTQIICWGTLFYPPVLTVPLMAAERGWSMTFAMGGFSLALLAGGLVSPYVGRMIDRHGGHRVMPVGSLLAALGLVALVYAEHPVAYLAAWMVLGLAIAASLYDPAFATLGRIFGAAARSPITALTLAGGFASTVSWPATHLLIQSVGWRGTYLVYAAVLALVAAPLHAFALPRTRAEPPVPATAQATPSAPVLSPHGWAFVMVATAFAAYAFVPSGLSAHLLAIFKRAGIDAATVVTIGALFGPAQVLARICELAVRARRPSAGGRAACGRHPARGFRADGFARRVAARRRVLHGDVRHGQRPDHHCTRRGSAGAVRPGRLWRDDRADRRPLAGDAGDRAAGAGLRHRAHVRSGGAGAGRGPRAGVVRLSGDLARAEES